jgi:cytochrome c oxidase subunit II
MHIVAQVQAMPGYTNVLRYTFNEPGVFRVLCLEYCGAAHHEMNADINVAAQ